MITVTKFISLQHIANFIEDFCLNNVVRLNSPIQTQCGSFVSKLHASHV